MVGKRGQVMCSSDTGVLESMYCEDAFPCGNRKRHCNVRSPFDLTSPSFREAASSSSSTEFAGEDTCALTVSCADDGVDQRLRLITAEWSDKIMEGLKGVRSVGELKEPLSNYLTEFYYAVVPIKSDTGPAQSDAPESSTEALTNRIEQLTQRNNVLCGVLRHQYELIRRLQGHEAMVASLQKEKGALTEELSNLKECVNAYVVSVENDRGGTSASSAYYGPFYSHFSRRPPDVC